MTAEEMKGVKNEKTNNGGTMYRWLLQETSFEVARLSVDFTKSSGFSTSLTRRFSSKHRRTIVWFVLSLYDWATQRQLINNALNAREITRRVLYFWKPSIRVIISAFSFSLFSKRTTVTAKASICCRKLFFPPSGFRFPDGCYSFLAEFIVLNIDFIPAYVCHQRNYSVLNLNIACA